MQQLCARVALRDRACCPLALLRNQDQMHEETKFACACPCAALRELQKIELN